MFDRVQDCYEDADYVLCISSFFFCCMAIFVAGVYETDPSEVSDARSDCGEAVAAGPETVVAGAIAED